MDWERLIGERFVGEAKGVEAPDGESGRLCARRREAMRSARRTRRACRPRSRTFVTVSLLLVLVLGLILGAEFDVEAGVCDLSAVRMCDGVTTMFGLAFPPAAGATPDSAKSIAPLNTSNNTLTSPVTAATFLVKSPNVVGGNIRFNSSLPSSGIASSRLWRIERSSAGVYGAK